MRKGRRSANAPRQLSNGRPMTRTGFGWIEADRGGCACRVGVDARRARR